MESKDKKNRITKQGLQKVAFIFKYIRPYRYYFLFGMLSLVVGSLFFMIFPGAAGEMTNVAIGKPKYNTGLTVTGFGWLFLIILVVQGVLSYLRTVAFAIVSEKGMADLRKDLYENIISQSISFYEQKRVGELTSRITTDVEQLQSAFSLTLAEFFRQVVILVVGVIVIAVLTPRLSLLMLLSFPPIVILAVFFGKYIRKLSKKRQDELAATNTIVEETLQSFSVVKSFANEWYESWRYGKNVDRVVDISMKFAKIKGLFFIFIITFLFGGIFFILWRGALMVESGLMEPGDLFSFIIYTGILGGAIASFGNLYTQLAQAIGATERVVDMLNSSPEVLTKDSKDVKKIPLNGEIQFENIHFSYPARPELEVLKGINLTIKPGQKIALVGQSGSGKSTIVQLLLKFYRPDSGRITIDGVDISELNPIGYRKNIGIVPQEVILFGGTIRENISYGKIGATEEEIIDAAQKANAWEFISSFPQGLDTVVGERGIRLSGGQRQRIAIARAILKDPAILILDEATSSLDAESERIVQDALEFLMKGRTSLIIAHRLATIRESDHIYVIDGGCIVESGSHDELVKLEDGYYNKLAKLQFDLSI